MYEFWHTRQHDYSMISFHHHFGSPFGCACYKISQLVCTDNTSIHSMCAIATYELRFAANKKFSVLVEFWIFSHAVIFAHPNYNNSLPLCERICNTKCNVYFSMLFVHTLQVKSVPINEHLFKSSTCNCWSTLITCLRCSNFSLGRVNWMKHCFLLSSTSFAWNNHLLSNSQVWITTEQIAHEMLTRPIYDVSTAIVTDRRAFPCNCG